MMVSGQCLRGSGRQNATRQQEAENDPDHPVIQGIGQKTQGGQGKPLSTVIVQRLLL